EIAGPLGVQTIEILSSTGLQSVVNAINQFSQSTGVSAALINPADPTSGMVFKSAGFGSRSFVSVKRLEGPATGSWFHTYSVPSTFQMPGTFSFSSASIQAAMSSSNRDSGRDVQAIVNGALANGDGLKLSLQNNNALSFDMTLDQTFGTTAGASTTFHITGGG